MNIHEPFSATLVEMIDIATDTRKFSFEILGESRTFAAGQFFLLLVDPKIARAYSIASSPSTLPRFDLLIKKVPNGAATENFLWTKSVGDVFEFRGPMGRFGISEEKKKHLFIATGTGIAPLRSLWKTLLEEENPLEITLFFGVRSEEFLFCEQEIRNLAAKYSNFSTQICLSQPQGTGDFFVGRVTDLLRTQSNDFFENTEVSLCGSKMMISEIKEILTEKGFSGRINVESW